MYLCGVREAALSGMGGFKRPMVFVFLLVVLLRIEMIALLEMIMKGGELSRVVVVMSMATAEFAHVEQNRIDEAVRIVIDGAALILDRSSSSRL